MTNFIEQGGLQQKYRYDTKFYVKDTSGAWVDFSDRSGSNLGVDKLLSIGKISNKVEIGFGSLVTTIQDAILNNDDGFFNKVFPSNLTSVDGTAATFDTSKGFKRSILRGRICQVRVQVRLPNNEIVGPITTINDGAIATSDTDITVVSTTDLVVDDVVVLGSVSTSYTITSIDSGTVFSFTPALGVSLPVTGDAVQDYFKAPALDVVQEEVMGTFSITEVVPDFMKNTVKLKLVSLDHLLQNKNAEGIKNGYDWFEARPVSFLIEEILKSEFAENGDIPSTYNLDKTPFLPTIDGANAVSTLGRPPLYDDVANTWRNDGFYTRALCYAYPNSGGTSGRLIQTAGLYLGCDDQLWFYDTTTGGYILVYDFAQADYYIKQIFYDSDNDLLTCILWKDERWGVRATAIARTGWEFQIWTWDNNNTPANPTQVTTGTNYLASMQYLIRPCADEEDIAANNTQILHVGSQSTEGGPWTESIWCPFPQHIQLPDSPSMGAGQTDDGTHCSTTYESAGTLSIYTMGSGGTSEPPAFLSGSELYYYHNRGPTSYSTEYFHATVTPTFDGSPAIYHVGQRPCNFLSNQNVGGIKYFYHFTLNIHGGGSVNMVSSNTAYDTIAGNVEVWYELNIYSTDGTQAKGSITIPDTLARCNPTCTAVNGSSDEAYAFFIQYNVLTASAETPTPGAFVVSIDLINIDTTAPWGATPFGTPSDFTSSETGDDSLWFVTHVAFFSSNDGVVDADDKVILTFNNRRTGQWVLGHCAISDFTNNQLFTDSTILKTGSQPFSALEVDTVDDLIYAFEMGSGKIYEITKAGVITTINETPVIANEYGMLSNLTINQDHASGDPEIFGISSPTSHLDSQYSYLAGKYNLFRVHQSISDLIEYADFEGLSKFEAIKKLVQSRDGISFFDRNGYFHYFQRLRTAAQIGSSDYTIDTTDIKSSLTLNYGYDRVFNVVKAQTYAVLFEPPDEKVFTLSTRTDKNIAEKDIKKLPFVNYAVEQKDTATKVLRTSCTIAGKTDTGTSRWKYTTLETEIEAILASNITAIATSIPLLSVFGGDAEDNGIHVGDFATAINPDTGEYVTRGINTVTASTNTIILESTFGFIINAGAEITIGRAFQTDSNYTKSTWSDSGVTYITTAVPAISDVETDVSSTKNLSEGTVVRFGDQTQEYRITAIISATNFTFERTGEEGATTGGLVVAPSVNDIVRAWWAPKSADGDEVGGSNIVIIFGTGTGVEGEDYEKTFVVGDLFEIRCPGKSLDQLKGGLQIAVSSLSMEKHGRLEFNIDNRFLTRDIAQEMLKRLVTYNDQPKFELTVAIPLIPYIDILAGSSQTVITIIDPVLFPMSENFSEDFTLNTTDHNLKDLTTTLSLLGTTNY